MTMAVSIEVISFVSVLPPVSMTVVSSVVTAKTVRSVVSYKALVTMCLPSTKSALMRAVAMLVLLLGVQPRVQGARRAPVTVSVCSAE
jgi:1-acyl-sn-glycerol-3-phosphate acyltransferase